MYIIPNKLLLTIKKILTDDPLDIYFEDTESFSTSIVELVTARDSEFGKLVGSANMLIASSLLNYELQEQGFQQEHYTEVFEQSWKNLIDSLKTEGFLRETPEAVRETIYLAVNNEVPELGLKKHSCLNKGEKQDECNVE